MMIFDSVAMSLLVIMTCSESAMRLEKATSLKQSGGQRHQFRCVQSGVASCGVALGDRQRRALLTEASVDVIATI